MKSDKNKKSSKTKSTSKELSESQLESVSGGAIAYPDDQFHIARPSQPGPHFAGSPYESASNRHDEETNRRFGGHRA